MKVETISEQLFFATVRLEAWSGKSLSVGTGFVYEVDTDAGIVQSLITNKHVLEGADRLSVTMIRGDDAAPLLGEGTTINIDPFDEKGWVGHPEPHVDVAAMPLIDVLGAMAKNNARPFFRSLSPAMMASTELLEDLDAIESVTFIGYPNGLYDSANLLPIARRGATATPVGVDYQGKPAFLIDASVFPGSSGSPVFLLDKGIYQDRNGISLGSSRFACLGIIAAVHVRLVEGSVIEVETGSGIGIEQPIDLGIVYKSVTIDETVDVLLALAGIARREIESGGLPGDSA